MKGKRTPQVLNKLLDMGTETVNEFIMIAKKIEETEPGCIGKKLYHLRVLASPYITAQDFLV
ncbi:unnamed protein product [Darwinula stevensoni]|uniref:Uncharacterized protein n=1 Tax=Darwinula stevensoni TaxID=69355 RepID=A0A7R9FN89_9CRUS|nr:unnamed protein product [Darwinula stevensoni]CAG0896520.1 unnamed protein product [Darwinula stevensoni]